MKSHPCYENRPRSARNQVLRTLGILCLAILGSLRLYHIATVSSDSESFIYLPNHCGNVQAVSDSEFFERRDILATVLRDLNASAYIVEPGANTQYYANFSSRLWSLSERPLLFILRPDITGTVASLGQPRISILTPAFEASRAKMLPIPGSNVEYIEWPEDANPFQVAAAALSLVQGTVFVDGAIRNFIADGLQKALPNVSVISAPSEVNSIRQRKSTTELTLLKCANEATLLSIRAVHKWMCIGMLESEARSMMATALAEAGLQDGSCLTLFGKNAALPHGSGSDRVLGKSDFILLDCVGSLHGYKSDITRTIALADSTIPDEHLAIWNWVRVAQTSAFIKARREVPAYRVDESARSVLVSAGYGPYFTHRLGHGIGLEVHEEPYLNGGSDTVIQVGHTFSDEPGVYIEGQVGVRLEDCFYINESGYSVYLTAGVGGQATSPWSP